jgi:uncharacterized protein
MISGQPNSPSAAPRGQPVVLAVALAFPTVLTAAYFVLLADYPSAVQQAVYAVGKTAQFVLPLVWVLVVLRERASWQWLGRRGIWTGLAFGAAVSLAMLGLYYGWLKSTGYLAGLEQQAMVKMRDLGLDQLWKYALLGLFYSLAHSLLEEYYWRWFVFGRLQQHCSMTGALVVSSLGFMAHHVVLLATFFGWHSPLAYVFSFAIAIGGAVWARLYAQSRSLLGPWFSHMLVDMAIFLIGFDLVHRLFQAAN